MVITSHPDANKPKIQNPITCCTTWPSCDNTPHSSTLKTAVYQTTLLYILASTHTLH